MNFYLIGVDYKCASLEVREALLKDRELLRQAWEHRFLNQIAVLATCNRFEVYYSGENISDSQLFFIEYFKQLGASPYIKIGKKAVFAHAVRLACGIESQLQGEIQIVEQLHEWLKHKVVSQALQDLWAKALILASEVRINAGLNFTRHNLAEIVYADLLKGKEPPGQLKIAVVGTGRIARLLAEACPENIHLFFISHKHRAQADALAKNCGARVLSFGELEYFIPQAHGLISATSSPHFILYRKHFSGVRQHTLFHVYDLAFPRDIDPQVSEVKGVVLNNLDTLEPYFERYNQDVLPRIQLAEYLIREATDEKNRYPAKQLGLKTS